MNTAAPSTFTPFRGLLSLILVLFLLNTLVDALFFHGILSSPTRTSGAHSSWMARPYTVFRMEGLPKATQLAKRTFGPGVFQTDVTFSKKHLESTVRSADSKANAALDKFIKP